MVTKSLFVGALVASVLVAGCGGGGGGSDPAPFTPPPGGGGVAKILSVGQVSIGGIMIGTTVPGDPVDVDGDVTVVYSPAIAATGTLTTTCGAQTLTGTVKASATGTVTFGHNSWVYDTDCSATVTFAAADYVSATKTVAFRTKVRPVAPVSVTLASTPDTIVAGSSTVLAWVPQNAANCLATGGWTGSLASAGGNATVTPTATTTYSIECWGSTGISTGVKSATVTVAPAPAKLEYKDIVVAIRPTMPLNLYGVDRAVPGAFVPIKNLTGKQFYSMGIRMPRADNCLVEVSALDNTTGAEYKMLYNPKTLEMVMDTTGNQSALVRFRNDDFNQGDYVQFNRPDVAVYPLWETMAQTPAGRYHTFKLDGSVNLWFVDNAGVVTQLTNTTYGTTGVVRALWSLTCKAP